MSASECAWLEHEVTYLNGGAGEDNATLYIKRVQCLVCKRF